MVKKLGILVGGGPAPGINSVISAATIRAVLGGVPVVGIRDGFERLMEGRTDCVEMLTIERVSRVHFRGGSIIGISRANPTKRPELLESCVRSLEAIGVDKLITIGGDDTAYSALRLAEHAGGRLRVVHVPKTIDNDLALPPPVDTFGFQTARHVGVELVKNLMVDAYTTARWYIVVTMGRQAGHLALGIGKAAGATLTLIPEEFLGQRIRLQHVVDILAGAVIKRLADGWRDGVAVIAEGVVLGMDPADLEDLQHVERDEHGHVRLSEIDLGDAVKQALARRLANLGIKITLTAKNIGYELRCADPIPYDLEYTRDLGYCAAKFLLEGGDRVVVALQGGQFHPIPFAQLLDPRTGRTRVRLVDVYSTRYAIARRYMTRLRRDDFARAEQVARLARVANLSPEDFRRQFEYLVELEPPPLVLPKPTWGPASLASAEQ